jgi:dCMP deaminase
MLFLIKTIRGGATMNTRVSWDEYFMQIADIVKTRSTCLRRQIGAVIVKDNRIITTGYNGAPTGLRHCTEIGGCERNRLNIPSGQRHELCRALHAEQNAIIAAPRDQMLGATLYMVCVSPETGEAQPGTSSCMMCKRMVINAGIAKVVIRDTATDYRVIDVADWIENDDSLSGVFGY